MPVIRKDAAGLYVIGKGKIFRPDKPTEFVYKDKVYISHYGNHDIIGCPNGGVRRVSEEWKAVGDHIPKPSKSTKVWPHFDKLGRPLKEGDFVCYPDSNSLQVGTVKTVNEKMCRLSNIDGDKDYLDRDKKGKLCYPSDLIVLDGPDVTVFLLKRMNAKK